VSKENQATEDATDPRGILDEKDQLDQKVTLDRLDHLVCAVSRVCQGPKVTWALDMKAPRERWATKDRREGPARPASTSPKKENPYPSKDHPDHPGNGDPREIPE